MVNSAHHCRNAEIAPRPLQQELPVWVGVGGTPSSAARAGRLGAGMAMAILGGDPARFKPLVDVYREAGLEAGHALEDLKVGVTGHGYISNTTQQAKEEFYPYYSNYKSVVNEQLGHGGGKMSRVDYDKLTASDTALFVGSPQQIVEKILQQHELFGHQRFMAQIDIGGLPFEKVAKSIELLATEVAPVVRKATKRENVLVGV